MKQKTKTLLAAVLAVGGVGIWIPQLLGAGAPDKSLHTGPSPAELPEGSAFLAGTPEAATPTPEREGTAPRTGESAAGSGSATRRGGDERLRALLAERRGATDLARLLGESSASDEAPAPAPRVDTGARRRAAEAAVRGFLDANPLSAVLVGADDGLASFGPFLVRSGEPLPGCDARLAAIGARHVELELDGTRLRVDLPPFRSRSAPESGGALAAETPPPAPQASVEAPAPAAPQVD